MSTMLVVGDLVWNLRADLTGLEDAIESSNKALQKTEKDSGGILGALTSKWAVMGGVAAGAAYAMIRASPSLGFAMEEVAYRFENMLAILGEEFAPLIEDIVIPALDALLPLVLQLAPVIGDAVEAILGFFKNEEMNVQIERYMEALTRIGTAIWDLLEPAIRLLWEAFKLIYPYISDIMIGALEGLATILEGVVGFFNWLSGSVGGSETVLGILAGTLEGVIGWFNWIAGVVSIVIGALEWLGGVIFGVIGYFDWVGGVIGLVQMSLQVLAGIIGGVIGFFDWLGDAIGSVIESIENLIGWVGDAITEFEKFFGLEAPSGWMQDVLGGGILGALFNAAYPGIGLGAQQSQGGGYVERSGLAIVHRGNVISERGGGNGFVGGGGGGQEVNITINIASPNIGSDYDVRRLVELLSIELQNELGRSVF